MKTVSLKYQKNTQPPESVALENKQAVLKIWAFCIIFIVLVVLDSMTNHIWMNDSQNAAWLRVFESAQILYVDEFVWFSGCLA